MVLARVGRVVKAHIAFHDRVIRQDTEAGAAEEILTAELEAVDVRFLVVHRSLHGKDVIRILGLGDHVVCGCERDMLIVRAVVFTRAARKERVLISRAFRMLDHREHGEELRIVRLAHAARLQRRQCSLSTRTCRLVLDVDAAEPDDRFVEHALANEVHDVLVEPTDGQVAVIGEIPFERHIQVRRFERQQCRVVGRRGCLETVERRAARYVRIHDGGQVVVVRACNGLAIGESCLDVVGYADVEVETRQQIVIGRRFRTRDDVRDDARLCLLEVIVVLPGEVFRGQDVRNGIHIGRFVTRAHQQIGGHRADVGMESDLHIEGGRLLLHDIVVREAGVVTQLAIGRSLFAPVGVAMLNGPQAERIRIAFPAAGRCSGRIEVVERTREAEGLQERNEIRHLA